MVKFEVNFLLLSYNGKINCKLCILNLQSVLLCIVYCILNQLSVLLCTGTEPTKCTSMYIVYLTIYVYCYVQVLNLLSVLLYTGTEPTKCTAIYRY